MNIIIALETYYRHVQIPNQYNWVSPNNNRIYFIIHDIKLLPYYPRRVGGHGYSSRLVCLFVTHESTHLAATALRLQHG